jgi:hypothetical protein
MQAARQLGHVRNLLGKYGYELCRDMLTNRMDREDAAEGARCNRQSWPQVHRRAFRECLQTLAIAFGVTGKRGRAPRDKYAEPANRFDDQTN